MFRTVVRYALPLLSLSLLTAAFLRARRFQPLRPALQHTLVVLAALPLVGSGTLHLLRPKAFLPLIPAWVPLRLTLIVLTGVPELCGACALFFALTRRPAAASLAVFMIAIFPANVYVAGQRIAGLSMPGITVRASMQAAYILLLLVVGYGWPRDGVRL